MNKYSIIAIFSAVLAVLLISTLTIRIISLNKQLTHISSCYEEYRDIDRNIEECSKNNPTQIDVCLQLWQYKYWLIENFGCPP